MSGDTSASKRGRRSRKRGHLCERAVCSWLRSNGYPDACTTRSRLGSDGFHAPGDVIGLPGWCVETKDVASSSWPSWCRQAEAESGGLPWVVVRRLRGVRDVGSWPARWSLGDDAVNGCGFGEFVSIIVPFYAAKGEP